MTYLDLFAAFTAGMVLRPVFDALYATVVAIWRNAKKNSHDR